MIVVFYSTLYRFLLPTSTVTILRSAKLFRSRQKMFMTNCR